ncbi:MAG: peptidyl-prolyl cis-trans isomerase SurA [Kiritimatiellia bacterium]|jgi:peptidyl-prolyl cis-trans isomerase SurA
MRALFYILVLGSCAGTPPPVEPPTPAPVKTEPAIQPTGPEPLIAPTNTPTEPRYAATHVLIAWRGAQRATTDRTPAQARTLADRLHAEVTAGADIKEIAAAWSDGPSAPRGGHLGVYATGTMEPAFESSVASVHVGDIAPLVRTDFGFHIIRRDAVHEVRVAHIQVNSVDPTTGGLRTDVQVAERIALIRSALQSGRSWEDVAKDYSEDPDAKNDGGVLGVIGHGQLPPAFDTAAFALQPGETSEPVTTGSGVHLIRRLTDR